MRLKILKTRKRVWGEFEYNDDNYYYCIGQMDSV